MHKSTVRPEELRKHHLFASLNDEQLGRLLQTTHVLSLNEGQQLFSCRQEAKNFYMVRSGLIRLFLSAPDGTEKVIHLIGPGNTFAEAITFMDGQFYPVNASALSKTEVLAFANTTFREILRESTDTCFRLMADMSTWLKKQIQDIDALTLQNATLRFTNYLLRQIPPGQAHDVVIELSAPKHVIASRLSIQPESFSRILRNMQKSGLIGVDGSIIRIPDVAALDTQQDSGLAVL